MGLPEEVLDVAANPLEKFKLIGIAVVVTAVLCVFGYLYFSNKEYKAKVSEQSAQIASQSASITNLSQKVDDLHAATQVTGDTIAAVDQRVSDQQDQRVQDLTKQQQQIVQIRKLYASMPQTASVVAQRETDISTVRINTLWGSYCRNNASEPSCL